jgi:SulP family sulfate permease
MNNALSQFIQVLKRVPLFQGLKPDEAFLLLKSCDRQLSVRTQEGIQVALIDPIAPVGEMGIFTNEPRSATVLALEPSALLVLSKNKLVSLMRRNPSMEIVISRNLIATLSDRLRHANREITHLQKLIADIGEDQTLPPDPAE